MVTVRCVGLVWEYEMLCWALSACIKPWLLYLHELDGLRFLLHLPFFDFPWAGTSGLLKGNIFLLLYILKGRFRVPVKCLETTYRCSWVWYRIELVMILRTNQEVVWKNAHKVTLQWFSPMTKACLMKSLSENVKNTEFVEPFSVFSFVVRR